MAKVLLLTDPACLGDILIDGKPYYTGTGDVDDIAAIILSCQIYGKDLTICICDDETGNRYTGFMDSLGNELVKLYGCTVMKEMDINTVRGVQFKRVYVNARLNQTTLQYLQDETSNIVELYTQGDNRSNANFQSREGDILNLYDIATQGYNGKCKMFSTPETKFIIRKEENTYTGAAKIAYNNYFKFNVRKRFGLPFKSKDPALMNALFRSDDVKNLRNGYNIFDGIWDEVNPTPEQVALVDTTLAYYNMGNVVDTAKTNVTKFVAVLYEYCDYDQYLVTKTTSTGETVQIIPTMEDLSKAVVPKSTINPGLQEQIVMVMDKIALESTPLFDIVPIIVTNSGAMQTMFGIDIAGATIQKDLLSPIYGDVTKRSLDKFNQDLLQSPSVPESTAVLLQPSPSVPTSDVDLYVPPAIYVYNGQVGSLNVISFNICENFVCNSNTLGHLMEYYRTQKTPFVGQLPDIKDQTPPDDLNKTMNTARNTAILRYLQSWMTTPVVIFLQEVGPEMMALLKEWKKQNQSLYMTMYEMCGGPSPQGL